MTSISNGRITATNVLFILGLGALVAPLVVSSQLVSLDVPLGIGVAVFTLLLAASGTIGRGEGMLLVGGLFAYTGGLIAQARAEQTADTPGHSSQNEDGADEHGQGRTWAQSGLNLFLIVTFAVFLLVRYINQLREPDEGPPPPKTVKKCPYCVSDVPVQATRCPHCTSELPLSEENVAEDPA